MDNLAHVSKDGPKISSQRGWSISKKTKIKNTSNRHSYNINKL